MYATVRGYEGVTDPSEAAQRVNEGFLSLISQVPGFVAYYWVDAGGGVMISTSVFQDQAGAEESNRRAADYILQNMVSCSHTRLRSQPVKLSRTKRPGFGERAYSIHSEGNLPTGGFQRQARDKKRWKRVSTQHVVNCQLTNQLSGRLNVRFADARLERRIAFLCLASAARGQ